MNLPFRRSRTFRERVFGEKPVIVKSTSAVELDKRIREVDDADKIQVLTIECQRLRTDKHDLAAKNMRLESDCQSLMVELRALKELHAYHMNEICRLKNDCDLSQRSFLMYKTEKEDEIEQLRRQHSVLEAHLRRSLGLSSEELVFISSSENISLETSRPSSPVFDLRMDAFGDFQRDFCGTEHLKHKLQLDTSETGSGMSTKDAVEIAPSKSEIKTSSAECCCDFVMFTILANDEMENEQNTFVNEFLDKIAHFVSSNNRIFNYGFLRPSDWIEVGSDNGLLSVLIWFCQAADYSNALNKISRSEFDFVALCVYGAVIDRQTVKIKDNCHVFSMCAGNFSLVYKEIKHFLCSHLSSTINSAYSTATNFQADLSAAFNEQQSYSEQSLALTEKIIHFGCKAPSTAAMYQAYLLKRLQSQDGQTASGEIYEQIYAKYCAQLEKFTAMPSACFSPLVLTGAAQCGKSYILARFLRALESRREDNNNIKIPPLLILAHFATPFLRTSHDVFLMLHRFIKQLHEVTSALSTASGNVVKIPLSFEELQKYFVQLLQKAAAFLLSHNGSRGILICIDGIDSIIEEHGLTFLGWLAKPLPVGVRAVISCRKQQCPNEWRSWPFVMIDSLSSMEIVDVLKENLSLLSNEQDEMLNSFARTHLRFSDRSSLGYLRLLSRHYVECDGCFELRLPEQETRESLLLSNLGEINDSLPAAERELLKQALLFILVSPDGLTDYELSKLVANFEFHFWQRLKAELENSYVLCSYSGINFLSTVEASSAIASYYRGELSEELFVALLQDYYANCGCGSFRCAAQAILLSILHKNCAELRALISTPLNFVSLIAFGHVSVLLEAARLLGCADIAELLECCSQQFSALEASDYTVPLAFFVAGHLSFQFNLDSQTTIEYCTRAREIFQNNVDPDHPFVAFIGEFLAKSYARLGKFAVAESLLKDAIVLYKNCFGAYSAYVKSAMQSLSRFYRTQNKSAHASRLDLQIRALRSSQSSRSIANSHTSIDSAQTTTSTATKTTNVQSANVLCDLAYVQQCFGKLDMAESLYSKAQKIFCALGWDSSTNTSYLKCLKRVARLFEKQQRWSDAEDVYRRMLKVLDAIYLTAADNNIQEQAQQQLQESSSLVREHLAFVLLRLSKVLWQQKNRQKSVIPFLERFVDYNFCSSASDAQQLCSVLCQIAAAAFYDQNDASKAAALIKRALLLCDQWFVSPEKKEWPIDNSLK